MTLKECYDELVLKYGKFHPSGEMVVNFSDKGSVHTYMNFYEKYLEPKRNFISLLEIGIMTGGSIHVWQKYFANYDIVGVDLAESWYKNRSHPFHENILNDNNVKLYFGVDSRKIVPLGIKNKKFDAIIDDGNHNVKAQIATLKNYWPLLANNGTYFIEDIHGNEQIKLIIKSLKDSYTYEVYEGRIDSRKDDRILAITKSTVCA